MRTALILAVILATMPLHGAFGAETGIDSNRAVNAIIGEAEGEGYRGMLAIACAIRNRGNLKGVYGEKASRVLGKKYSQKTLELAQKAWAESATKDITNGADHWGGKAVDKAWIAKMKKNGFIKTFEYGNQEFYKRK